jgi:Tol biopolymer transport system component
MAPGVIAFISDRDGNREIYSIKPDGSQETRLTDDKRFNNGEPVWSPDGKSIAFVRQPPNKEYGEAGDIWVMRADGSQAMQISPDGSAELQPRWSPDSQQIAYISNMSFLTTDSTTGEQTYAGAYDVYISNADGSNLYRPKGYITLVMSSMGELGTITNQNWSPDGQSLAYVDCGEQSCSILGIKSEGGRLNADYPLTQDLNANTPTWSPGGKKIAFDGPADCQDCGYEVYLMNADGSDVENLTDDPTDDWGPVWSPDGLRLAFVSDRDGDYEIYVIDLASREITQLTKNAAYDAQPTWSPDGKWIAYTSDQNNNVDLYIVNIDEKQSYRLTTNNATDQLPYWSPATP